ncbi:MAG: 4Fe-4S dicluster domain-containing protein, partial [Nitrospinota bacterium]
FKKSLKTSIFLLLSTLTGLAFTAYFIDVYDLWHRLVNLQGPIYIWTVPLIFMIGSYIGVAILREQLCFWLCPYARLQGVMVDDQTYLPTYDFNRGEPRARIKTVDKSLGSQDKGDCIDCNLCVATCPTGVDIRNGQQEGCITCGICIDACNMVMEKIKRPTGLIRYISLAQHRGEKIAKFWMRPRVLVYIAILTIITTTLLVGSKHIGKMDLVVLHHVVPPYTMLSDGSIKNRYMIKVLNKTDSNIIARLYTTGLDDGLLSVGDRLEFKAGKLSKIPVSITIDKGKIRAKRQEFKFNLEVIDRPELKDSYSTQFIAPEQSRVSTDDDSKR